MKTDTPLSRTVRSGLYLVNHFAQVPLLLIGFGNTKDGAGVYPALQNAMLAARAEGIGSTLTGFLTSFFANEVMDILGARRTTAVHARSRGDGLSAWEMGNRRSSRSMRSRRNSWQGDLGFTVPEPLWPK